MERDRIRPVRAVAQSRTPHATYVATASAVVVALIVGVVLVRVQRPWVAPATVAASRARSFSCGTPLTAVAGTAHGSVDDLHVRANPVAPATSVVAERGAPIIAHGWATDGAMQQPVAGVCILIDGRPVTWESVTYGIARPDVAQALRTAAVADTGFEIRAAATGSRGEHRLEVVGVNAAGAESPIAPAVRLTIR